MPNAEQDRIVLRRQAYDFNAGLSDFADRLEGFEDDAAGAVRRARQALFEAWTILCAPPEDEGDEPH